LIRETKQKGDPIVIGPGASKLIGKYQIVQFDGPSPTVQELFLTKFQEVMANGQPRGDWKIEGNKLVLTLALNNHKRAVMQVNGEDGLIGAAETRDGQKCSWELKRARVLPPLEEWKGKVDYLSDMKERRVKAKLFRKDSMMSEGNKEYPIEVDGVRLVHSI